MRLAPNKKHNRLDRFGVRRRLRRAGLNSQLRRDSREKTGHNDRSRDRTDGLCDGQRMLEQPDLSPPSKISPLVVWLCTDAAANVNGRTFEVWGNTISLLSEPEPLRTITGQGGWDLDSLDQIAPASLVSELTTGWSATLSSPASVMIGVMSSVTPV